MTMASTAERPARPRIERLLGMSATAALWTLLVVAEVTALLAFGPGHTSVPPPAPVAEVSPYAAISANDPAVPAAGDTVALTP